VDVTERFRALVHGPEVSLPLDEAALLIAAHAEPGLDLDAELARLDELAAGVANPTLDGLRRHLFGELGFRGADHDYDDPRNSYLHVVVERRVGIPISLSVLLMEVGRRIGVPLAGCPCPATSWSGTRSTRRCSSTPSPGAPSSTAVAPRPASTPSTAPAPASTRTSSPPPAAGASSCAC
jgi:hypothetical protein